MSAKLQNSANYASRNQDDDLIGLIMSNADASGQYVIFRNANDGLYALNVAKVEELIAIGEIELTANSEQDSVISGIAKVRGNVIPIVNFDRWLGSIHTSCDYELVMICNYGGQRFGLIIKNVLGILSIDSNKLIDNSDKDFKTSFVTEISLSGVTGLCLIFDSDQLLMNVFPKIGEKEHLKTEAIVSDRVIKGKILSAEDSSIIRSALKNVYDHLKLDYELFADGDQLIKRLNDLDCSEIALIITDLEMPVMDGIKMIENLRSQVKYDDIPVIVNTNMANGSVASKCYSLGVKHIIPKLDVEELSNAIKNHAREV